jgi:uracil-DNA glycosylase
LPSRSFPKKQGILTQVPHAQSSFSESCRRCPRLARYLKGLRIEHPDYHARPVAPFGSQRARVLIVGLAPGKHGANRTGRPFTGDHAGGLLYETLHAFGFASRPVSFSIGDGLRLVDCRITNAVKCLPPANRPQPSEIRSCNAYLAEEIASLPPGAAILALGTVAHAAVLMALGIARREHPFSHGARHELPRRLLLYDSYHCSRYNTQTKRLTPAMFRSVVAAIRAHLSCPTIPSASPAALTARKRGG